MNPESEQFRSAYASLNVAQKQAVDSIEGPVMVIAGPGTGKTQILTLRIANILLKTDTQPENILALTFTESGATAMRNRLRGFIGSAAYRVNIFTFHGLADYLIRNYPDSYERVIGGRPASELEKITFIETVLDVRDLKLLRPSGDPSYYVGHILREVATMKREYITPDRLAEIIVKQEKELSKIPKLHEKGAHKGKVRGEYTKKEKSIAKNHELLSVYRQYEALLSKERLYDFEDMILETISALKSNEDMLRDLQEQYQYVLADEHQDVNASQNKILELLTNYHESPNIFVVGDEKQAIYRFQGASLENFLYFEEKFPGTTTISLTENYRSGQAILDAAHSLIKVDEGPAAELRLPLTATSKEPVVIEGRKFSHQAVEDNWVAKTVSEKVEAGTPPEEIAVIVRTNREVEALTTLLRKEGLPVTASAEGDILHHPITTQVLALIEAVVERKSETALFTVLHGTYWNIPASDLVRVLNAQSYSSSLLAIINDSKQLEDVGVSGLDKILWVGEVLAEARAKELTEAPHQVLEYLLQASGLLEQVMANDPHEGARVVRRLYDEVESMVVRDQVSTLRAIRDNFAKSQFYHVALTAPYIATNTSAVTVMTAHKAKGLEFNTVIVPHLTDSAWGGTTKRQYFDIPLTQEVKSDDFAAGDDERRLLYVAMTRAKQALLISSANERSDGRSQVPSRLLEDIDAGLLESVSVDKEENNFSPVSDLTKSAPTQAIDETILSKLLSERGLSATALNNYLKSPWTYLYRNVLRIPEVQPSHMLFGTAMHNTMERITRFHTAEGKQPSDTEVKKWLERELEKLPLSKTEFTRRHEQGLETLYAYIDQAAPGWPKRTEEELSLRVILETGLEEFPELMLAGKLDRLDFRDDGTVIRVVDYKTGKPKTRGQIEGKTQTSDGGYKRQLVFYALLLSLYGDERYECREGVLAFLEPDAKGKIHEEAYTITDVEIEALKTEIIRVTKQIISGEFLSESCDPDQSDYCHLVEMLRGNN